MQNKKDPREIPCHTTPMYASDSSQQYPTFQVYTYVRYHEDSMPSELKHLKKSHNSYEITRVKNIFSSQLYKKVDVV